MTEPFVHLNVHSEYSIKDSIVQIKPLFNEIKMHQMNAVALTDLSNLFGAVKFYRQALREGVKPIIGAQVWTRDHSSHYSKVVLLCQNLEGYRNLTQLITLACEKTHENPHPFVEQSTLFSHATGLIALSGAQCGDIGQCLLNENPQAAAKALNAWQEAFGDRFYLELQRNQREGEARYEKQLIPLAQSTSCPIVATNEVIFLHQSDFEAHKARVCIQEGTRLDDTASHPFTTSQYLKSNDEMQLLFQDMPNAINNSVEIAKRCNLILTLDKPVLPSFPVPDSYTEESYLREASQKGLAKRLDKKFEQANTSPEARDAIQQRYDKRLERELSVINTMGFPGYFLIVADFIQWAKANQVPVGPGRGSGAGSLVAYALEITGLDPIEYKLLFERFLNPERVSMPDFDIDFCMEGRDRVIDYVTQCYGRENVSQIATFGTMAAKAVIRDVGRVLGHPYGFVDKIAKLIPFEIGITLEKALEQEEVLKARYQEEEEVKGLIDLAKKLEGITRNVGKHAGGVVIAPSKLTDFAPLYFDNEHNVLTQFDKDDVEGIGLIKFDFLGLKTLTIIDWAVQHANALSSQENPIDIESIPLDCKKTFSLLKACTTTAVFQLESRGMKELIKRLQPDQFEEIIALVALFRPGPLQSGMVDDFINRKHGRAKVEYLHPAMEPILKPTYGVILYQEQVMQIAQTLAGYTLGGADLLRRAMGKKKPEEMAKQRTIFTEGAVKEGVEERIATTIFDLMEKFAGYGFNKSHSAAYAMVAYQTAWLKAHYPSCFMAAVLSADMNNTDKVVVFIDECKQCDIDVLPPCVLHSDYLFNVNTASQVRYGLGAIKGVGEAAIQELIEKRQSGAYRDLFDLCRRVDLKKVNRRVFEALIKSGSLDAFSKNRAWLMSQLEDAIKQAEQLLKNKTIGQADLFALEGNENNTEEASVSPWTMDECLRYEKESLGLYFSGHPLKSVEPHLSKMGVIKYDQIKVTKKESKVKLAGIILSIRSLQTKNGDRMAICLIDDRLNRFELAIFPQAYQENREFLIKDQLVVIEGMAGIDKYSGGLRVSAQHLYTIVSAREKFAKQIQIQIESARFTQDQANTLKSCITNQPRGQTDVIIHYQNEKAKAKLKLDSEWSVQLTENALQEITACVGETAVEIEY